MKPETQRRVDEMMAEIDKCKPPYDESVSDDLYEPYEQAFIAAFDMAEALYVFAADCGEYNLFSAVSRVYTPSPVRVADDERRGLSEEGYEFYRELLQMEELT